MAGLVDPASSLTDPLDLASGLTDPLDQAFGLADPATNGGEGTDPATTDADPATSSGVGVDPTTSGVTTFPEAGPALGLRVGSASGLDFFVFFIDLPRRALSGTRLR